MDKPVKRSRASKPKVRTGCTTCKIRRVKCDEGKPECIRCKTTGRKCDGYLLLNSSTTVSNQLSTVMAVTSPGEPRALEFFFHRSAPQLAGFFEGSFWKASVLQLSLSEPAIRQAVAAIGSLHEQEGYFHPSSRSNIGSTRSNSAVQLYSRAIRSIIEKAASDQNAIPVVVMASILFTCFEFLRRDAAAAATHIASGIKLLRTWREKTGGEPKGPWGQKYSSFVSHFMETELAPILTLFNINASEFGLRPRNRILLNAVDDSGLLVLADRFETLREARVGLVDLTTAAVSIFQELDEGLDQGRLPSPGTVTFLKGIRCTLDRWRANFRDLTRRRQLAWDKEQTSAADVIRIMWHSVNIGITTYQVGSESEWDAHRSDYEEIIRLADSLVSDPDRYPDELSKTLSLDLGLIFPLHAVAWKCRWPHLRRQGLDMLLRIPKREWLLDARHYHTIFSHIMAIEEAHLRLAPGAIPEEDVLPPEHVRVHDFYSVPQPATTSGCPCYAVTFLTKPSGLDKEWHSQTEYLFLQAPHTGEAVAPSNLLSCKQWASPEMTNLHIVNMMKAAVFGLGKEDFHPTVS